MLSMMSFLKRWFSLDCMVNWLLLCCKRNHSRLKIPVILFSQASVGQHLGQLSWAVLLLVLLGSLMRLQTSGGLTGAVPGSLSLASSLCSVGCRSSSGFFTGQSQDSERGQAPKGRVTAACGTFADVPVTKASHVSLEDRGHLDSRIQDSGVPWGHVDVQHDVMWSCMDVPTETVRCRGYSLSGFLPYWTTVPKEEDCIPPGLFQIFVNDLEKENEIQL